MEDYVTLIVMYVVGVVFLCRLYQNPDEFDLTRFQIALIIIFWPLVMIYVLGCLIQIFYKDIRSMFS